MGTTNNHPAGRPGVPRADAVLLRLQLIGRMQALTLDNRSVLPLGRKTRALLAILALSGRRPVLRIRLAELLWSRRSEEQARASLRQEIHRLLDALGPVGADVITVDRHMLTLRPGLTAVDAERILNAGPNQVDSLPAMNGVLLEELSGTDPALDKWLKTERDRLHDHAVTLFEGVLNRQHDPRGVLEGSRQLLLIDPLHEGAWRAAIRARLSLGEITLAREVAERCVAALAGRPGLSPSPDTLRLLGELELAPAGSADPDPDGMIGAANGTEPERPLPVAADTARSGEPPVPVRRQSNGLPLLAVLPLVDLDGRSDRPELTHGIAEALRVTLLRYGPLQILSGSELDVALSGGRDDSVLRNAFNVDFVLDGTVQGRGMQQRVVMRLVDIRQHGQIVWGSRLRADGNEAALPEQVVGEVSGRLPVELLLLESQRLRHLPLTQVRPEQMALRALSGILTTDRRKMAAACELIDRSRELGVDTPMVMVIDALAQILRVLQRWDEAGAAVRALARSAEALEAGTMPTATLLVRCLARSEIENDPDAALVLAERARALEPYSAAAWAMAAFPLLRLGRLDEAERCWRESRQLFPTHPLDMVLDLPGVMLPLLQGRYEDAARAGLAASELRPCFAPALVPFLSALGHLRRDRDAAQVRRRLLALWPDADVTLLRGRAGLRGAGDAERLASGLTLAGLPMEAGDVSDRVGQAAMPDPAGTGVALGAAIPAG
ncbi:MAG: hypothetical protein INR65_01850 [Gluconacetobacter diazotrophicus]|nr:hypothetical protein [Gluconacetobacter diazotrophicus]